jgi:hypothetical protein
MKKAIVLMAVGLGVAVLAASAWAAPGERTKFSGQASYTIFVGGCDGLIAEGGIPAINPQPADSPWTHNFTATADVKGWTRQDPDSPIVYMRMHLSGGGTDAAGHSFTIDGDLSLDQPLSDFFANDGNVVLRRDDGSFARGSATGMYPIVYQPPLAYGGSAIYISASQCRLR